MTAKIGPCCLCGGRYELYGYNPHPLAKKGRCCRDCNQIVIEARIAEAVGERLSALVSHGDAPIRKKKSNRKNGETRPIDPMRARFLKRPPTCCIASLHGAYRLLDVNRTGLYALAKLDPDIMIRMRGKRVVVDIPHAMALQKRLAAAEEAEKAGGGGQ